MRWSLLRSKGYEKNGVKWEFCATPGAEIFTFGSSYNVSHSEQGVGVRKSVEHPTHPGYFMGTSAPPLHLFSLLPVRDIVP